MKMCKRLTILFLLLCLLTGCVRQNSRPKTKEEYSVALMAKSETTEFWKSVIAGAEAASAEYNIRLSVYAPETEEDYEAQNELVRSVIHENVDAIVFSAIDYENNAEVIDEAAMSGIKIIGIDSDVHSDRVSVRIGTDNIEAGRSAYRAAHLSGYSKLRIGLVNYDPNSANGQARESGVRQEMANDEDSMIVDHINIITNASVAQAAVVKMLKKHPDINVVIAFNEPTSVGTAKAIKEMKKQTQVWMVGFDSNIETVDMLQTGVVDALIVQNPYAMGYLAMENAYNILSGQEIETVNVETPSITVTKQDVFDEINQKYLFPFQ